MATSNLDCNVSMTQEPEAKRIKGSPRTTWWRRENQWGWKSWNEVWVAPVEKAEYKYSVEAIYVHQDTSQREDLQRYQFSWFLLFYKNMNNEEHSWILVSNLERLNLETMSSKINQRNKSANTCFLLFAFISTR